jgi:hypothetical protein
MAIILEIPATSRSFLFILFVLSFATFHASADPDHETDTASWLQKQISDIDGFSPTPWLCGGPAPNPPSVLEFHANWHCTNRDNVPVNFGNRFFGFHKQFLQGYNAYLASVGESNIQVWEPSQGAIIPPAHSGRDKNQPCGACQPLEARFRVPPSGQLNTFATLDALGRGIITWHNNNHGSIASAGGTGSCLQNRADMACPSWSPRDPIFYRYHHIFDEVQDAWRTLQPSDIAIVLDRSGSMELQTEGGGTRLDAAKSAAKLFVDLFEDGSTHKVGMVSFSTTASTVPDMPLTSIDNAPAVLSAALAGLTASGSTSIGHGLIKAQSLVNSGTEARKAIILLTDGQENFPPYIADAMSGLGDTHVCSIGLGTPGSLDGPKLVQLSERQGGIYISTPDDLELHKFFVVCFANIFDTVAAEDPIETLKGGQMVSAPVVHNSVEDEKIVFVLSWRNSSSAENLRLAITTPSGSVLDLNAPGVPSRVGPTWHIVRVKTPYYGERDGSWYVRAVRPIIGYINGLTSRSFVDFKQGVAFIQAEISTICSGSDGCRRILYFEDDIDSVMFEDRNSIYAAALQDLTGRGILGNITHANNAKQFAEYLDKSSQFDLLVYSSQYTKAEQPYDGILAQVLCGGQLRSIISDNRNIKGALEILRCAGAMRGKNSNFTAISPAASQLLAGKGGLRNPTGVIEASYELLPYEHRNSSIQATFNKGEIAVLAVGKGGKAQEYFISVLAKSPGKVKPTKYRNNTYTLEDLHPTFRLPVTHIPTCGYSRINATVNITRPLTSLSGLLSTVIPLQKGENKGDALGQRELATAALGPDKLDIKTETSVFQLFDDGTHGDTTPHDNYWEAGLPSDFTAIDGEYHLHARFTLCTSSTCSSPDSSSNANSGTCGKETCIVREAQQTITILAQMSPKCKWTVDKLPATGSRSKARVKITPADQKGTLLGPGYKDELIVATQGDIFVEGVKDFDGRGTYEIAANFGSKSTDKPALVISQYGRPKNAIRIDL